MDGQPNILFLVADDMRPNIGAYQDINSPIYSSPPMHTPNIDALASSVNIISVQQELIIYLCRACYSPEHMLSKPSAPLAEHPYVGPDPGHIPRQI